MLDMSNQTRYAHITVMPATSPGFKSRVPGASFSYIVSITKGVIFSRDHTNLHKTREFGVDWVKWKRDTSIQISKEMYGRRTILATYASRVYIAAVRWPKRVKHKSIFKNTNQYSKTQINIQKHKSIFKNTNQYSKTQTQEPKHAPKLKTQVSGMVMNSADFTARD